MIDSWFLMESSDPMLYILGAYLIFVLKIGPKIMEKRPAFQLNTFMILYNAFQVLFNAWIVRMVSLIIYSIMLLCFFRQCLILKKQENVL